MEAVLTKPKILMLGFWKNFRSAWSRRNSEETLTGYLLISPALILFLVFGVYPFYRTIAYSFTSWDGISSSSTWLGLQNYQIAFSGADPLWWKSLQNGVFFAVTALIFMNGIALCLAVAVDQKIRGQSIYRSIFYLPTILSGVVVAIIWKWLYQPIGGPINQLLTTFGLGSLATAWLADINTVRWAVSIASIWMGIGSPFLLFLAGLQSVPVELYEAGRLDGANGRQLFWYITLPFLIPVATILSVLTILGAMQIFNLVLAMTNGGPGSATEVPVLNIYRQAFKFAEFGYATALSMIFGTLLFTISIFQMWLSRKIGIRAA